MRKLEPLSALFCVILSGCFFPTQESEITKDKSAKRLAQMAAPLIQHMKVTVNDNDLVIRSNSTQLINNDLEATLVIVPLSKFGKDHSEIPCVAGFLRVDNLSDTVQYIESDATICYENPGIESQLEDVSIRVTTIDNQTCLSFENLRELSKRGDSGDFASLIWYVCQSENDQ